MNNFFISVVDFFQPAINVLKSIKITDCLDIVIVAFLIYKAIQLVKQTRAEQLVKGIIILLMAYFVTSVLKLTMITYILRVILDFGVVVLVVLFQPELRRALEKVGHSSLRRLTFSNKASDDNETVRNSINAICRAVNDMHEDKIGALIVIERQTRLGEIAGTGTILNAVASDDLLKNIFYPKAPLHDGAVIIRDGYVYAAGCILPLTQNKNIFKSLGTRHRAALGISENSDAIVIVVSEETGQISAAVNGVLTRDYNFGSLHSLLDDHLLAESKTQKPSKGIVKKIKSIKEGKKNEKK